MCRFRVSTQHCPRRWERKVGWGGVGWREAWREGCTTTSPAAVGCQALAQAAGFLAACQPTPPTPPTLGLLACPWGHACAWSFILGPRRVPP